MVNCIIMESFQIAKASIKGSLGRTLWNIGRDEGCIAINFGFERNEERKLATNDFTS